MNHHPSSIKENGDVDASGASAVGYGDDEEDQLLLSTSSTLVARESASVLERGRCPYAESDSDILGPSEQALYGLVVHSGKCSGDMAFSRSLLLHSGNENFSFFKVLFGIYNSSIMFIKFNIAKIGSTWCLLDSTHLSPLAADGLAVGAACLSGSLALTASVGSAILIHKFPVAFGLSSFLRGSGWEGWRLQRGGGLGV